jgi:serine phosphatase RsbU (regulator of sigma subunit)
MEWISNPLFIILALFFYLLFGKTYLQVKENLPKWNRAIIIQIIAVIVFVGFYFLLDDNQESMVILAICLGMFLTVSTFIIVLIPAILSWKKGTRSAGYFVWGNIMLLLGLAAFYIISVATGKNGYGKWAMQVGAVLEIIIFSIGIGAKVNNLNKEKTRAQGETIKHLEENEKLKDKVNRELEEKVQERTIEVVKQKHLVEEKNNEITDSINYAKRIQSSILPPLEEIHSALPNSFVLFKPKDIVSGDFYWFHKTNDSVLIAAADCTGHGVPGAFMSMLNSDKLNEAVEASKDVSKILQLVNVGLKKALRQSDKDDSTRDGMDIAICKLIGLKLEYAGANRPLWIIPHGKKEIEETKATKTAIGGLTEDEQEFTKHTVDLQKGDTVYIFTDGFADQFSPDDKKLMTKKFKETLYLIQEKSMEEQREFLNTFIENWKGNMEQTDDILVIGVRV